jgi:uncharacterized protein (DUF302 family)
MLHTHLAYHEQLSTSSRSEANQEALTSLALLAAANPQVAEQLLRDPVVAARSHPHYVIDLNEEDRRVLSSIKAQSASLDDFLYQLADAIEDMR